MCFSHIWVLGVGGGWVWGGGGGAKTRLVHNLLMQFFSQDSSKIEFSEPYFLILW